MDSRSLLGDILSKHSQLVVGRKGQTEARTCHIVVIVGLMASSLRLFF